MRLEILLTFLLFFAGTACSGYALRRVCRLRQEGFLFSAISGVMLWWAVLEVITIPLVLLLGPFQVLVKIYSILLGLISLLGLFCWRDILEDGRAVLRTWKEHVTVGHVLAFILMCYQLYFIHHHMYLEWDDAYYVNIANEAVNSNMIFWVYPETGIMPDLDKRYVLSLWPIFYAWLSQVIGVSPTVMAHTILPWIIIPLVYMLYALIGKQLFKADAQMRGFFLCLVVLVHLFMTGEHTAGLTFLSITPWVGKGVLANVLLPVIFYWILRVSQKDEAGIWRVFGITCLGGCLLSSMGIMLVPIFVGVSILAIAGLKKSWKYLYKGILVCMPCVLLGVLYIILITSERNLYLYETFF